MSLRFYMGSSGSGKSYQLYQEIIEKSLKNPAKKYLIVVPDQFTMQTQKDICMKHPRGGIMNIDVLSFGRLSYRIFEEVGKSELPVLDDTGKNLILRKIAQEKGEELKVIRNNLKKTGYIHEIKSAISEFMQYGIGVEELEKLISFAKQKGTLFYKLEDLKTMYQEFLNYKKDHYITSEETLTLLKEVLYKSQIIKGSTIVFDGFTGFTPVQNEVIKEILTLAEEVVVAVTIDVKENCYELGGEQNLFYLSKKTVLSLEKLAEEVNITRDRTEDIRLDTLPLVRYRNNPELAHLEQYLFRYLIKPYEEECHRISITEASTMEEEVRQTCVEIMRLIREKGFKYQDIAVITGDLTSYGHYVEKEFLKYGIPYFIDSNRGILLNPLIEYIKSALETVIKGYTYETMFHFLRSGMTDIGMEEMDALENYVLALGIRGEKKWKEPWVRKSPDMGEEFVKELETLNVCREKITALLIPFSNRKKKAGEITQQLYQFIAESNLQQKLQQYETQFKKENKMSLAKEYAQIYRLVMDLLNQIMELLPEEKMNLQEYSEILFAGFEEIQVGTIPQNVDQIVIGDMERTRLKEIKALFVIGINEGMIPKSSGTGGIISDMEREFLKESEYELAPTPRQKMYIQRFYLYMNMTKPTDFLFLSYAKVNGEGNFMRPSYLIGMLRKLFPNLLLHNTENMALEDILATKTDGIDYLVTMLREYAECKCKKQEQFFTLFSWYQSREEYQKLMKQLMYAAFYHYETSTLSKVVADALYGKILENSVSRLEKYAACAYSQFLKYGLELSQREEFSFERVDMGNVFHGVLEKFAEKLEQSEFTWFDFPKEAGEKLLTQALEVYAAEYGETILYSSARNEYVITRMKRILLRTIKTLQYQLKKGVFKPSNFELSFSVMQDLDSVTIALSEEEKMRLHGRIDRVDTYEDNENVYVKVIDYKSGNKSFDLVALYYGLQLQLVVYLNAAMEMEKKKHGDKNIIPAAILYYHLDDPFVQTDGSKMSEEEINQSILEQLRMKGVVNAKQEVIQKLDTSLNSKSDVIPVEYKKDGNYASTSSIMEEANLHAISNYVNQKIQTIGKQILAGDMQVNPYEMSNTNACTYCLYKTVCGFDARIPGYEMRKLDNMSKEGALEQIVIEGKETE